MDERFEAYFQERLNQLSQGATRTRGLPDNFRAARSDLEPAAITSRALRTAKARLELQHRSLRSDAELLLYLAFTELVAQPVTVVRGREGGLGRLEIRELPDAVASDIELITQKAVTGTDAQPPISAHRIITVTSQVWDDLQSGHLGVWG